MANMSYCRFENTSNDVADCQHSFTEELEAREHNARIRMIEDMISCLESIGYEISDSNVDESFFEKMKINY